MIGTSAMYALGELTNPSAGCPANTLTVYGFPPGLLPLGTWLSMGTKYPDMTPATPKRAGSCIAMLAAQYPPSE